MRELPPTSPCSARRAPAGAGSARVRRVLWLASAGLAAACTGPATHVHNEAGHRCFVDGIETVHTWLPFRYYGTSRWDAQPADTKTGPDWDLLCVSRPIDLPPPASLWLFPFDLPLELARRAWSGREDVHVTVVLPATPPDMVVQPEFRPTGIENVAERARQARSQR